MSKNEKKLIDKIIKNETFEKGIDYNEEDFLDIKNGLENLANRMSRKTPQQFISYENKNPYFKKNLMQYFKNNSYYIDNNSFVSFINKKEELDVFLEIAHKNNNVHMELKMMLKNQKIRLTDIISIIDSKNISAEIIKNLTKELIEREDLTEDTLNYFKNRSQLQKIREIYVGFEYFLSENKNLSVQRYKLLNNEFDFKNTLRSDIFINNNNGHINQYYEIYNYKESELLKNKELFKFILNDYNDIINHTKLLNQLLSNKNKPTKEDIIILLKHYNNDFIQFDDEISVKLYNISCHYIKSIDEFINLNKYINQSDMDVEKIKGACLEAADVNHDGKIYATDYVKIKNYIMGTGDISQ